MAPLTTGTTPAAPGTATNRFLVRAGALSAGLVALGSLLGLVRDLLVAALFGASGDTDAFLVAWTVPETVSPLLVEGTMALVMVPAFGRALAAAGDARRHHPAVDDVVAATFARIVAVLIVVGGLVVAFAPWLVDALAPGLAHRDVAVDCMRLVSVTVPLIGVAGYMSAALRSHGHFGPPAAIYLAYNVGIIGSIGLGHSAFGVRGAAAGLSVGAAFMVLVQLGPYLRHVGLPPLAWRRSGLVALGAFVPVGGYTLLRQAQVFVERYLAAPLEPGTISHLNYAQKVAQVPLTLSAMAAAVTFPILARSVAAGRRDEARRRMETDLLVIGAVALLATAFLATFAPAVVALLFQRGEFGPEDTAATAAIMRVYVLGLLGQAMVDLLCRSYFTRERPSWLPAAAMTAGLLATAVLAAWLVRPWGAAGIALANAAGITLTGVLLAGSARGRLPSAPGRAVYARLALLLVPTAATVAAGALLREPLAGWPPPVAVAVGGVASVAIFAGVVAAGWWLTRARRGVA
ncbi:putative peptidoglycan lipid II flippase [Amycolatopsis arida]|uniref:Putative peptidoglycan lipid II flippase n=1 Tax=Amycolatopsis arida TaxID=587909 RepID=A0A1I5XF94_9PSEU|nr:lipid II flippase MurJ [Amycolatopsis arida]TDX97502.1 putative peptidoglycan lipid II flippase [Amycolatopsis arida]SFQ30327.1 putative peptidoglycan lipid II flippase [Amycolatopsis arida]